MIGFWIFMLVVDLLIPATMIGLGKLFLNKAPHTINSTFGYRTTMSMKSQDTWQFAHHYCGKIWLWIGWILVPASVVPLLFAAGCKDIETIGYVGLAIAVLQIILLAGSMIPTEIALKKVFDQNGRRKMT